MEVLWLIAYKVSTIFRPRLRHFQKNRQQLFRAIGISDFDCDDEPFNSIVEPARMASLNQEKRYFNMTYQQIKDWMEGYEIWD